MPEPDWSLENDGGDVAIRFADGEVRNLGPRDEAFVRLADFMGDDGVDQRPGYDEHADPGDFGVKA